MTDKTRGLARLTRQCVYVCARAAEWEGDDKSCDDEDEEDSDDESVASLGEVVNKMVLVECMQFVFRSGAGQDALIEAGAKKAAWESVGCC